MDKVLESNLGSGVCAAGGGCKGGLSLGRCHREDFPIFRDSDLVYLDSAASTQKPECVIRAVDRFYREFYANIHRGVYTLSVEATRLYEECRDKVKDFINARHREEIVFTRGATESINLVTNSWGRSSLQSGDEILLSVYEHHSNLVPWQMIAKERGASLKFIELNEDGSLDLRDFENKISKRTRILAVTQMSNALGVSPPLVSMIDLAKSHNVLVLVDGAQAVAHQKVDVQELGADFYVFSGHKLYGPTGVGVLYGKLGVLEAMPPFLGGGEMIRSVTMQETEFESPPTKFEAGTPDISAVIGLSAALDYINSVGVRSISASDDILLKRLIEGLKTIRGVRLFMPEMVKALCSFDLQDLHPHDLAEFLAAKNIAVRAGHHCAQVLMSKLGVLATTRASLGLYNTPEDVDCFVKAVDEAISYFGRKR